jgi:predicted butyrate kinase (DUF1464 family)
MLSCVYIICNKYANGMHRDAARRLHQGVLYCTVSYVLTVHRIAVTAFTAPSTVGLPVRRLSKNSHSSAALRAGIVYGIAPNVDTEYVTYALRFISCCQYNVCHYQNVYLVNSILHIPAVPSFMEI